MRFEKDYTGTWTPDEWVIKLCDGVGEIYKGKGIIVCKVKDAEIKILENGIEIITDDAEINSPWSKIERCDIYVSKHKRFGYCKYKRTGGIFIQMDPEEKEMLVVASRGPLMAQLEAAKNEAPEIRI